MEEHCLYELAELAKEIGLSIADLFNVINWLLVVHEFSVNDLDNHFLEDLTVYKNLDEAITANIGDAGLSSLINTTKEAYLEANDMFELQSLKVVHLIDKF